MFHGPVHGHRPSVPSPAWPSLVLDVIVSLPSGLDSCHSQLLFNVTFPFRFMIYAPM